MFLYYDDFIKKTNKCSRTYFCIEEVFNYEKTEKAGIKKEVKYFGAAVFLAAVFFFLCFRTADTANAGTENTARYKYYTSIEIEDGSTLWEIAHKYMTEEYESPEAYIQEIKQINHLDSDVIYEGSYLCIPYYSSEYK